METAAGGAARYFEDLGLDVANAVVILDLDGTLVPDCGTRASPAVVAKVRELKARGNDVHLCSNSRRPGYAARIDALASQLEISASPVPSRKPSLRALEGIDLAGRAVVIVGDKDLTDGLLARRSGARFVKVRRKVDPGDRPVSRLTSWMDDVFGPIALFLWDLVMPVGRGRAAD
jgi:HAD superfamily phosphatase (TIGR01668 family)